MNLPFVFNLTLSLLIVTISPFKFNVIIYMAIYIYFPVSFIFFYLLFVFLFFYYICFINSGFFGNFILLSILAY